VKKLTTGPRAALFIAEREQYRLEFHRSRLYGAALNCAVRMFRRAGASLRHRSCDASFPQHRVVDFDEGGHEIYIAIALLARR
jgi:hypothetical protein